MQLSQTPFAGLVGIWRRPESADQYPDELEIRPDGIYFGKKGGAKRSFTLWDAGKLEVTGADQVCISTANDARITYHVELRGNEVTFRDPGGISIHFKKAGS